MNRELVLGAAMFVLLLVVAVSIALIVWDQPDKDAHVSGPGDPPAEK